MNKKEDQLLLETLIERKIISLADLKNFTETAQPIINSEGITQAVIKFFKINEIEFDEIIADKFNIPFLYSSEGLQWVNVPNLPDEASAKYRFIPIIVEDLELTVAFVDPPYPRLIELLENTTHRQIVPVIITPSVFDMLLMQRSKTAQKSVTSRFDFEVIDIEKRGEKWASSTETAQKLPSANSVFIKLIESAMENKVSHIHLELTSKGFLQVRFRMNDVLLRVVTLPIRYATQIPSMVKQFAKIENFQVNRVIRGRAVFKIREQKINFVVNVIPTNNGEKLTIKLLEQKKELINIDEIGLSEHDKIRFQYITSKSDSLILFSSPQQNGKTTTMFSFIEKIKQQEKNIMTIENENIEFVVPGIHQIIYAKAEKLSLQDALDSVESHDVDIFVVDEVTERLKLKYMLEIVLNNINVFSTITARNSIDALYKLLSLTDKKKEELLLALGGIVSQKLVRKVCPVCSEKYRPEKDILEYLGLKDLPESTLFSKGTGCQQCMGTGYLGMIPLFETLVFTDEMRIMLHKGCSFHEIKKLAVNSGYTDLRYDGLRKAIIGITTLEEVIRKT